MSNLFVVCLGMGTVFIGLGCMIFICKLMSALCLGLGKKSPEPATAGVAPQVAAEETIPNRQEFIAAISAAIAEEMQSDVSKIRILSVKKI